MRFGRKIDRIDFPQAKCLRLRHLRHLERLFADNYGFVSLFPQKVTFPSLELLELQGLQNLGDVWGSELLDFSFSKLKELEVEDCGSLTDLFPPSMAGGLVNLQKLVIKNCQKMKAVVGREEEIEDGQGRAIEKTPFPQLIVLELHRLPNLSRFCYFTHSIESQLRRIYISDCPSMEAFSLGNVSAPNLSLPRISWNGNLNNAIQLLQEGLGREKIVINVATEKPKPCSRAVKIAVGIPGVESVTFSEQDKNHLVVTGDGIDVMALMHKLRKKVRHSYLLSVGQNELLMDYGSNRDNNVIHNVIQPSGYNRCNPYAYGPGHEYETAIQNLYSYGSGHGYDTRSQNSYAYGPGYGYETKSQTQDSCYIM
ncbi:hypothetical protein Vadar_028231 [Vaccinium darrowii]|uniref:Uncharacterized protein n=1 Tax=Vaccinium darrowii TaxID=229202 RepID=A0ACB7YRE2_9ERIC|nr:hypothetical protein Vadar_028231 [Vaccinium darrowii]